MEKVYIVSAARTPIGKMGGVLSSLTAVDLGTIAVKEVIKRSKVEATSVKEVFMGNVISAGNGQNPARQVALRSGMPNTVEATTINAVCASGLQSINLAAKLISMGDADCIVAGGMESMSNAPYLIEKGRFGYRLGDNTLVDSLTNDGLMDAIGGYHMGITAENIAEKYSISRQQMDQFAFNSQQKAVAAQKSGAFTDEIVEIDIHSRRETMAISNDEAPRLNTSLEKLATLRPAFKKDGRVTAGNSSGINDGAAAVMLVSESFLKQNSLTALAEWTYGTMAGLESSLMGLGPIYATQKLLERTKMTVNQIDLFEINEAFAAQMIPVADTLKIPAKKININGGAIALGHPLGASGARILVSLIYELLHSDHSTGLASLCVGGGMGCSTLIKKCAS